MLFSSPKLKKKHPPMLGLCVAALISLFVLSTLFSLFNYAPTLNPITLLQDSYYWHVTKFSFYQASLSTLLSVGLAIPVAVSFSRRNFTGKSLVLKLFASTLVLPVLVGVFGVVAIYGNSGVISELFELNGQKLPFSIYGLNGILLAHLFFNLPYATRLLVQALDTIPFEQHQLSTHLGLGAWQKLKLVELPRIRQQLPHVAGLVFMLCFTSFATVMALGGGPKSTTIELAIYQAIKFDFDLQSGALLAIWQMLLCLIMTVAIHKLARPLAAGQAKRVHNAVSFIDTPILRIWDRAWIAFSILLVIPPLAMVILSGLNRSALKVLGDVEFWQSVQLSFSIAVVSAGIALVCGIAILLTSRHWRMHNSSKKADSIEIVGTIILVTPGIVISTGLFLLLRDYVDVFSAAVYLVIAVNSLMALPYVIKNLAQPLLHIAQQYQMLSTSLGLTGLTKFKIVEWRALRAPMGHAFAISFMLSMGDLSAIALFGSQDFRTLPLYLFQLMGSYQMDAAAVVSLVLFIICVGGMWMIEKLFLVSKTTGRGK
jgi:thiamine transport system permease protein